MSRRQTEAQDIEDAHGWLQQAVERLATAQEASQANPAYETRCGLAEALRRFLESHAPELTAAFMKGDVQ